MLRLIKKYTSMAIVMYLILSSIIQIGLVFGIQQATDFNSNFYVNIISFIIAVIITHALLKHRLTQKDIYWIIVVLIIINVWGTYIGYKDEDSIAILFIGAWYVVVSYFLPKILFLKLK